MKGNPLVALLCAGFVLALAALHPVNAADGSPVGAVPQQNGTISGQIANAATGAYLEGARVEVRGTSLYFNWDNIFRRPEVSNYRAYEDRVANTRMVYPSIATGVQGRF